MSKIGNKYIIEIANETVVDCRNKYWVKGFSNMCLDDNALSKFELYKEIPEDEKDAKPGDVIRLGDNGTTDYLVIHVEERNNNPRPLLHLINLNNRHVQTYAGRYKKTGLTGSILIIGDHFND